MKSIVLPEIDVDQVIDQIGSFILDTVRSVNATGVVVGLSGGVDSTVAAAIAYETFLVHNANKDNDPLALVGCILPSSINLSEDTRIGKEVASRFYIEPRVKYLDRIIEMHKEVVPEAFESNFHRGNMISRIRANVLHTIAATENKIVLGTGNKDEDFGIGYYTLFGDGAVHLSPIGNLSKRLVRQLACRLRFSDIANKTPTAGLEPGQTDFDDLGYSYDTVELVTEGLQQGFTEADLAEHPQVIEQVNKDGTDTRVQYIVSDICERHDMAKKKVQIVSPPIAPVTLQYGSEVVHEF